MDDKKVKVLSFEEDAFDLQAYKKAADAKRREKARIKRIYRKISVGKVLLAIAAFSISVVLYYLLSSLIVT